MSEWPSYDLLFVVMCLLFDVFVLCLCDSGFLDAFDVVFPGEDVCEVWIDTGSVVAEHLKSHPREDLDLCASCVYPVPVSAPLLSGSRGGVSCRILALIFVSNVIMALI